MNNFDLLSDLQKIDAGVIDGVTPALQKVLLYHKTYISGIRKLQRIYTQRKPENSLCTICDADVIILHHIMGFAKARQYNGDVEPKSMRLGIIWICPNCHHKVHNRNPYYLKSSQSYKTNVSH